MGNRQAESSEFERIGSIIRTLKGIRADYIKCDPRYDALDEAICALIVKQYSTYRSYLYR